MTNNTLDEKLRDLFHQQADHLNVPRADPKVIPTRSLRASTDRTWRGNRSRLLLLGATVFVVATAAAGVASWASRGTVTIAPANDPARGGNDPAGGDDVDHPFDFDSQVGVRLRAAELAVDAGGRTFTPSGPEVAVKGDPGNRPTPTEAGYTTLELEWFEDGIEMRIYLYFTANETEWWVTEVRTRDGASPAEWITLPGEYARTPLGQAFTGDLEVGPLQISGLVLEAFLPRPTSCDGSGAAGDLVIDLSGARPVTGSSPDSYGYSTTVQVLDAKTCEPVEPDGVEFRATIADQAVAVPEVDTLRFGDHGELGVSVNFTGPGETTLSVTALDVETGNVVASLDIPVTVTTGS